MDKLSDRVILVNGGARDVGAAICNELALLGASLVVIDADFAGARDTVNRVRSIGARATALDGGLADEGDVERVIGEVVASYGRLDAVVSNICGTPPGRLEDLAVDEWDRVLTAGLRVPFLLAKHAAPMLKRHSGCIVNVLCSWALEGEARAIARQAATWGLLGLSQGLEAELAPYQVRVRTIVDGQAWKGDRLQRRADAEDDDERAEAPDALDIALAVVRAIVDEPCDEAGDRALEAALPA